MPEQMEKVLESMASWQSTICDTAWIHRVPVTTLHNRVSGCVTHGMKPGPVPYMNTVEEKTLGIFLRSALQWAIGR